MPLKRAITLPLLIFYGTGTMLGAGIYALIGEVAGTAGTLAPYAFVIAAVLAAFTGASYAEFSVRHPRSAGEAAFVNAGFGSDRLAMGIGLLIVLSGIVSAGVMVQAIAGYAGNFINLPPLIIMLAAIALLGGLALWGISQSIVVIALITTLEAGVLLLIIILGGQLEPLPAPTPTVLDGSAMLSLLSGAVLAFYAYIGFEDMVNVAEEVQNPERAMPIAILSAIVISTLIYVGVAWVAIRITPLAALSESAAPMALIFGQISPQGETWVALIALLAVSNGALVQIIMASRVIYGLANQKLLPARLGSVSDHRNTPGPATFTVLALLVLSTLFSLGTLARVTSLILLIVFATVNLALIRVKMHADQPSPGFAVPLAIPATGFVASISFAFISLVSLFLAK